MLPRRPAVPWLLSNALVGGTIATDGCVAVLMVSVCVCFVCYQPTVFVLYCLYMICYLCGVYLIFLLYFYFICIDVMLGMESAGDVVISAGKRNADVKVAISFFPRKVDVLCMLCWSCLNSISLCWVCCDF